MTGPDLSPALYPALSPERAGLIRSALFVPATRLDLLEKALAGPADAVIVDLEDAVGPAEKPAARRALRDRLGQGALARKPLLVRVNGPVLDLVEDLRAVVGLPGVQGLVLPKAESPSVVHLLQEALEALEASGGAGASVAPLSVVCLVESVAGLAQAGALAALPRVCGLALGPEDYAAQLGVEPAPGLLGPAVVRLAEAARPAGKALWAVPDTLTRYDDPDALLDAARAARGLGATGALCIHPRQVEAASVAFDLPQTAVDWAARVVAAFADPGAAGGVVAVDGRMVDRPVHRRALAIVAAARARGRL